MGIASPVYGNITLKTPLFLMKEIFAAIFFTSIGLSINPTNIPSILPMALLITGLAIVARFFGGIVGGGLSEYRGRILFTLAIGLSVKAEMSLIIAREAVVTGIVPNEFLSLVTIIVIGSIIVTMPIFSRMSKHLQ